MRQQSPNSVAADSVIRGESSLSRQLGAGWPYFFRYLAFNILPQALDRMTRAFARAVSRHRLWPYQFSL